VGQLFVVLLETPVLAAQVVQVAQEQMVDRMAAAVLARVHLLVLEQVQLALFGLFGPATLGHSHQLALAHLNF
jgi:hypothetical protein